VSILWADLRSRVGLLIIATYLLFGTAGVVLVEPPRAGGPPLVGAFQTLAYPLGTDSLGRGILAQLIHATPPMLKMITAGAAFATVMAVCWGLFAGYKGGSIDRLMTMIADGLMAVPGLPLIVVLAAVLQPENPFVVGIILTVNGWAGLARQLRAETLKLRHRSYVEASRAMGIGTITIVRRDILPNVMPLVLVNFVSRARDIIVASVGLYFLGILPISDPNWGVILNLAYQNGGIYSPEMAHWLYAPMVTIVVFSLGLLLFGQGCDRIFNPRIRARHIEADD
jgi:peptide/nickel transport system permease protein